MEWRCRRILQFQIVAYVNSGAFLLWQRQFIYTHGGHKTLKYCSCINMTIFVLLRLLFAIIKYDLLLHTLLWAKYVRSVCRSHQIWKIQKRQCFRYDYSENEYHLILMWSLTTGATRLPNMKYTKLFRDSVLWPQNISFTRVHCHSRSIFSIHILTWLRGEGGENDVMGCRTMQMRTSLINPSVQCKGIRVQQQGTDTEKQMNSSKMEKHMIHHRHQHHLRTNK